MIVDDDYRERIFTWIDSLEHGFRKTLFKEKPSYDPFVQVCCEAIELDPLCGLEFNDDYTEIRFWDISFKSGIYLKPNTLTKKTNANHD